MSDRVFPPDTGGHGVFVLRSVMCDTLKGFG